MFYAGEMITPARDRPSQRGLAQLQCLEPETYFQNHCQPNEFRILSSNCSSKTDLVEADVDTTPHQKAFSMVEETWENCLTSSMHLPTSKLADRTQWSILYDDKGQIISKGLLGFFNSPKKRTNFFCPSRVGQKLTFSSSFLGELKTIKFPFEIN